MKEIRTVCVYCGSGAGANPAFEQAALRFGRILAENGVGLVYGGGSLGLMGAVSKSVVDHGGRVTGIIPDFLTQREKPKSQGMELIITRDMHERKQTMFERADAFVALPGGIGTLEELVEQMTWAQLGRHKKPVLIANIEGFWDPLCDLLEHMTAQGFIRQAFPVNLIVVKSVDDILPKLEAAARAVPETEKEMTAAPAERM
jgi:uncharacterized protein (TIGR00730 family)